MATRAAARVGLALLVPPYGSSGRAIERETIAMTAVKELPLALQFG